MSRISFVLPVYREAANLRIMVERIARVAEELAPLETECVFVDDHSPDETPVVLGELARAHPWVRFARLAKNSGSHVAIICGLAMARGDCAIILASDGQDPPELAPELIARWRAGAAIVWGARRNYRRSLASRCGSWIYYRVMNGFSEVELHPQGADMALLDRRVIDVVASTRERNSSLWELITWLGFEQDTIYYDKAERMSGVSGWTLRKKIRVAVNSLLTFSYAPIRAVSLLGFLVTAAALVVALVYVVNYFTGGALLGRIEVQGWTTLLVVLLLQGGILMLMLGLIGEYVWRILDQVRGRPLYMTEYESDGAARAPQTRAAESSVED